MCIRLGCDLFFVRVERGRCSTRTSTPRFSCILVMSGLDMFSRSVSTPCVGLPILGGTRTPSKEYTFRCKIERLRTLRDCTACADSRAACAAFRFYTSKYPLDGVRTFVLLYSAVRKAATVASCCRKLQYWPSAVVHADPRACARSPCVRSVLRFFITIVRPSCFYHYPLNMIF